jgi:pimeloyl-ACP methyl ester carboxylesterase
MAFMIAHRPAVFALALVLALPAAVRAQGGKTEKTLYAADGWEIAISYYPSPAGKESPVVVFLHGEEQHRRFWEVPGKSWPEDLRQEGIASITVDLRKHGASKPAGLKNANPGTRDYQAMVVGDMEAVKKFIYKEHQDQRLNMRKMAIVATDMSCPIALSYAQRDWLKKPWPDAPVLAARTPKGQDVRALVLISPVDRLSGVNSANAISTLRNPAFGIAVLTIYGENDPKDGGAARKIYERFKDQDSEENPRIYEVKFQGRARGMDLVINNANAQKAFTTFLDKHLKGLPEEWVDRRSPIDTTID